MPWSPARRHSLNIVRDGGASFYILRINPLTGHKRPTSAHGAARRAPDSPARPHPPASATILIARSKRSGVSTALCCPAPSPQ
eukprot:6518523-Prymnesium_polylepis.2